MVSIPASSKLVRGKAHPVVQEVQDGYGAGREVEDEDGAWLEALHLEFVVRQPTSSSAACGSD